VFRKDRNPKRVSIFLYTFIKFLSYDIERNYSVVLVSFPIGSLGSKGHVRGATKIKNGK